MVTEMSPAYRKGVDAEARSDRAEAIRQFQEAVQRNGSDRAAKFKLSYHLDLVGEEDQALSLLDDACAEGLAPVQGLVNLAVMLEDAGQYVKAERCLQMVVHTDPNHARARLFLKDVQHSRRMVIEDEPRVREIHGGPMNVPVTDFELSARARNCLAKMGIRTLGDLLRVGEAELMAYKNFGETTLLEIKALLSQRGLKLGQALEHQRAAARDEMLHQLAQTAGDGAADLLGESVDELNLSVRARKALALLGAQTLGDVVSRTEAELLGIKNFGSTSLDEIKERLAERGLGLRTIDEE